MDLRTEFAYSGGKVWFGYAEIFACQRTLRFESCATPPLKKTGFQIQGGKSPATLNLR